MLPMQDASQTNAAPTSGTPCSYHTTPTNRKFVNIIILRPHVQSAKEFVDISLSGIDPASLPIPSAPGYHLTHSSIAMPSNTLHHHKPTHTQQSILRHIHSSQDGKLHASMERLDPAGDAAERVSMWWCTSQSGVPREKCFHVRCLPARMHGVDYVLTGVWFANK